MGEIWPKKKSAGRRSIIEGSVLRDEVALGRRGPGGGGGPVDALLAGVLGGALLLQRGVGQAGGVDRALRVRQRHGLVRRPAVARAGSIERGVVVLHAVDEIPAPSNNAAQRLLSLLVQSDQRRSYRAETQLSMPLLLTAR